MDPRQLRHIIVQKLKLYTGKDMCFDAAAWTLLCTAVVETQLRYVEIEDRLGIFGMREDTYNVQLWDTVYKYHADKRIPLFRVCNMPAHLDCSGSLSQYIPHAAELRTNLTLAICTSYERYMSVGANFPPLYDNKPNPWEIFNFYLQHWHPAKSPDPSEHFNTYSMMLQSLTDEKIIDDIQYTKWLSYAS